MPIYEYEHIGLPCALGKIFEQTQGVSEEPLARCPNCGQKVKKLISLGVVRKPTSNSELRDHGFTKLVKRDNGIYENVTAREGESRIVDRDKPETMASLKPALSD